MRRCRRALDQFFTIDELPLLPQAMKLLWKKNIAHCILLCHCREFLGEEFEVIICALQDEI